MDENTYIYIMFSGVAIITVLCKVCLKSKCDTIEICGGLLKVHRDTKAEEDIEMRFPSPSETTQKDKVLLFPMENQPDISNVGTTSVVFDNLSNINKK